jgi:hypothetical protein
MCRATPVPTAPASRTASEPAVPQTSIVGHVVHMSLDLGTKHGETGQGCSVPASLVLISLSLYVPDLADGRSHFVTSPRPPSASLPMVRRRRHRP